MNKIWIAQHPLKELIGFKSIKKAANHFKISPSTIYNSTTYKENQYYVTKDGYFIRQISLY